MIKIGREEPVASMDNGGKIIWAKHNEIQTVNIKAVGADFEVTDGERLPLAVKELGSCDLYPQVSLKHNPNGRFVVVCGDGEYIIYTALAWRNRSFGSALEFVWSTDGEYAVRESTSKIKIFNKTFQERKSIRPTFSAEGIFGGTLLAVRSNDFVCFYDWAECRVVRRIDVNVKNIYWSDGGDLVAIASDSSFYILKYNVSFFDTCKASFENLERDIVTSYLESGKPVDEQGVEDAFELLHEISERIRTGVWVGDCFIYNNSTWRLNYCVGGEVTTMYHLDRPMYLLGYLASQSRVYLIDKEFKICGEKIFPFLLVHTMSMIRGCYIAWMLKMLFKADDANGKICDFLCEAFKINSMFQEDAVDTSEVTVILFDQSSNAYHVRSVMSYTLLLSLIEYKTLILRGDFQRAEEVLPTIPKEHLNSVARFLESRGMLEEALEVATDPDYRFDLAVQLGRLEVAKSIAEEAQSESKWKQLGELAMSAGQLDVAQECLGHAADLSGLLLLYSALGDAAGLEKLAASAKEQGKNNVAFLCLFLLRKLEDCVQLLVESNRIPEAAFFARTYLPSEVSEVVGLWRNDLKKINQKAAESLADPQEYPNLFPDWQWALDAEARVKENRQAFFFLLSSQT
ncbi:hypothetical protein Mapa_007656 [Marchantia paleacea]|nr:hypothetical protein Mapa_007656 [Marchantia paleacea]